MKEVVLRIKDSAFEKIINFLQLCPMVEVVSTSKLVETKDLLDKCFHEAVSELWKDKVFRRKGEYGYIMLAINDNVIKGFFFYSPTEYLDYLKEYVEIDGKMVLEFKPYNRQPRKKPLILTLRDLVNGWIKMGRRHVGVYAAVSSKLSPEDIVDELKRDVCDGLDKVLEDGAIEEMKEYFNLLKKKEG